MASVRGEESTNSRHGQLVAPSTVSWSQGFRDLACGKTGVPHKLSTVSWSRPPRSVGRGGDGNLRTRARSVGRTNLYRTYILTYSWPPKAVENSVSQMTEGKRHSKGANHFPLISPSGKRIGRHQNSVSTPRATRGRTKARKTLCGLLMRSWTKCRELVLSQCVRMKMHTACR